MRLKTLLSAHEILHTRQQWRPDWSRKHHSLELAILNRIAALELDRERLRKIEALPGGWSLTHYSYGKWHCANGDLLAHYSDGNLCIADTPWEAIP